VVSERSLGAQNTVSSIAHGVRPGYCFSLAVRNCRYFWVLLQKTWRRLSC